MSKRQTKAAPKRPTASKRGRTPKASARKKPVNWRLWGIGGGVAFIVAALTGAIAWFGGPTAIAERTAAAFDRELVELGFAVEGVEISGAAHTSETALRQIATLKTGKSIFAQDLDAIRERIAALPWVKQVAVARVLPAQIHIDIVERQVFALWQHDRKVWLIDRDGQPIIEVRASDYPHLALVVGKGANEAVGRLRDILARQNDLAQHVTAAIRVGERRWDLQFDSGTVVALPEENEADAWVRFADLDAKHDLLGKGYARLDMRLPGLLVARPEDGKAPTLTSHDKQDRAT